MTLSLDTLMEYFDAKQKLVIGVRHIQRQFTLSGLRPAGH